jgi:hypothetical protein
MVENNQRQRERRDWNSEVSAAMVAAGISFDEISTTALESSKRRMFLIVERAFPLLEDIADRARGSAELLGIEISEIDHVTYP